MPTLARQSYLFSKRSPAKVVAPVALECLTEQRVERLAGAQRRIGVRRNGEGGDVSKLLELVFGGGRLIEAVGVLEVLGQPLEEGQRFTEVHLRCQEESD